MFYRGYKDNITYFHHNHVVYLYTHHGKFKHDEIEKIESLQLIDAIYENRGINFDLPDIIGVKIRINDLKYRFDETWTELELLNILEDDYNIDLLKQIKNIVGGTIDDTSSLEDEFQDIVLQHARLVKIMKEQPLFEIINQIDQIKEELKTSENNNKGLENKIEELTQFLNQEKETNIKLKVEKDQLIKELNQLKLEKHTYKIDLLNKVKIALDA